MATIDPLLVVVSGRDDDREGVGELDPGAEELLPPILVVSSTVEDADDELLFEPESPTESRASSGPATPPSPEQKAFVWSSTSEGRHRDQEIKRSPEPTTRTLSLESFLLSQDSPTEDTNRDECVSSIESSSSTSSDGAAISLPLSTLNINAKLQAVKDKTQRAATQQRDVISRFQLKGGLVGWLHGESGEQKNENETDESRPTQRAPVAGDTKISTARPRASSLFGNLYDKMKQTQEQLELKLQALDEFGDPQPVATTMPVARPKPRTRLSLQPTSTRKIEGIDNDADDRIGFDNFVSSEATKQPVVRRESRLRSASSGEVYQNKETRSVRSRLRSLSFATRPYKSVDDHSATTQSASSSASVLQLDAFSMEDCLSDPKLAAEFVNAVMPGDEWLLTLLYSIEEYETLTSTASSANADESAAPLESQVMMALTIIDRFLVDTTRTVPSNLQAMGKEIRTTVVQYQRPSEVQGAAHASVAAAIAVQATALPMTLFDNVYTCVFDKLRDAFDTRFRLTREYTQLQAHRTQQQQQELQLGDERVLQHLVLTFDQVIESEWCCTVFWVYLFRTGHHHRLSFIMDVKFKLRRLHLAAQQAEPHSPGAVQAYKLLQQEILLICRRFLTTKTAALALPTTSPMLARLKDELCIDVLVLERSRAPELTFLQSMIDKLDAMRTQTRVDFKRMSFERFASFLTSPLYRDFVVHPSSASSTHCTRADDLTQLLRVSRIPFHQTAVSVQNARDLRELSSSSDDTIFDRVISSVFTFQCLEDPDDKQLFEFQPIHASSHESESSVNSLMKTSQSFLVPDKVAKSHYPAANAQHASVCFNFLAGTGDSTVYGAVWRFHGSYYPRIDLESEASSKPTSQVRGVCVLSRYPLVDSLREFLHAFASEVLREGATADVFSTSENVSSAVSAGLSNSKLAFEAHCRHLLEEASSVDEAPLQDLSLQDLFESLSITHVMRIFSLILQEKKIVMVSSSYSVLLCVGEALRAIIHPLVWSHIYVPVLPLAMKGYLHCPTPFIFGLHTSYARHCELPKPSDDLAVVNLDRDSITGGGEVYMPPQRANLLRDKLTSLYCRRLRSRDLISFRGPESAGAVANFPSRELCAAFHEELGDILRYLETFAFRFECVDRAIAVVDTSNKSRQWPADAARFYSALLQSQAFSTHLARKSS